MDTHVIISAVITSAVVASIISSIFALIGQKIERDSRRKELALSKAAELAVAQNKFTKEVADTMGKGAIVADAAHLTSTYYFALLKLIDKNEPVNIPVHQRPGILKDGVRIQ